MKYSGAFVVFALAATAMAMPAADLETRNGPPKSGGGRGGGGRGRGSKTCNAGAKQVCCNGVLNCVVQVLGSTCTNTAYCCNTGSSAGSLINISALNCVKLL